MVRDTVAVETLARLAISRVFMGHCSQNLTARSSHCCIRLTEMLPDRSRHTMARLCPKNHARHFFRRTFLFSSRETSAANDSRSRKVSPTFLDVERPDLVH